MESAARDILIPACKLLLCVVFGAYALAVLGALACWLWAGLWDRHGWFALSPAIFFCIVSPGLFLFVGTALWESASMLLDGRSAPAAVMMTFGALVLSPWVIALLVPAAILMVFVLLCAAREQPDRRPLPPEASKLSPIP